MLFTIRDDNRLQCPAFSEKGYDDKGDYNIMRCIGIIGAMEVEVASLKKNR